MAAGSTTKYMSCKSQLTSMLAIIVIVLLSPNVQAELNDWTLVPGVRAGAIHTGATQEDLKRIFGEENVRESMLGPEETEPGLVVYKGIEDEEIDIWLDQKGRAMSVELFGNHSRWHFANRAEVGMTTAQLQALNGFPVKIKSNASAGTVDTDAYMAWYDFGTGKLKDLTGSIFCSDGKSANWIQLPLSAEK